MSTTSRLLLAAFLLVAARPCSAAGPVLLTFNVETTEDAAALEDLDLKRPATFFFTGAFSEQHEDLVRRTATASTIGSLSYAHPDLTTLGPEELHRELQLGKLVLEKAAGRPVRWFRAPYLRYGPETVRTLAGLGFTHDSSDQERWSRQLDLFELPVSNEDGGERLASDYDLFESAGFSDPEALAWLKARFDERRALDRPLVLLLRPRIIARHRDVLDDFFAHVESAGGEFLTADDYMEKAGAERPTRFGVWVDFSQGPHDAELLRRDLVGAGITDVFLQAKDPDGKRYYPDPHDGGPVPRQDFAAAVTALRGSGIRVHAWISANRDPFLATRHPDWAMVSVDGRPSPDWISPSSPRAVASLLATVRELLDRYDLDGIHLDYLRYPDFDHDFSTRTVEEFRRDEGIGAMPNRDMFDRHYNAWIRRRSGRIAAQAAAVAKTIAERHAGRVILSAALYADAATSYRVMEKMGQDYSTLAPHLGFVVPMAYIHEEHRSAPWIAKVAAAARYRVGHRELLAGLEAWQRAGVFSYTPATFRASLDAAGRGWSGQVFYAYSWLFGRGRGEANLPPGSLEQLSDFRRESGDTSAPAAAAPNGDEAPRGDFPLTAYVVAAFLFATAGTAAALGRKRRSRAGRRGSVPRPPATPGRSRLGDEWTQALALEEPARSSRLRALAADLSPAAIERFRLACLLDALEGRDRTPKHLGRTLVTVGVSPHDALRTIDHGLELGCIELENGVVTATGRGLRDLEAAVEDGFRRELWTAIEGAFGD